MIDLLTKIMDAYGLGAFGLVAFAVVFGAVVYAYRAMVRPHTDAMRDIATAQAQTAAAMRDTTETAERIMAQCHCKTPRPGDANSR